MGFRELFITFALIGVFILCMVNFGVQIAQDNESNESILNEEIINRSFNVGLNASLTPFQDQAEEQQGKFEEDSTALGAGFFMLEAILNAGKIFSGMIVGIWNLIFLPLDILGIPRAVIGVMATILIVSLVLFAWRAYKSGA